MRHFMWQAVLTARFGARRGPHRSRPPRRPARRAAGTPRVDQHNNAAGQAYGAAHVDELQPGSAVGRDGLLVPVALEKWESDELVWVRPH